METNYKPNSHKYKKEQEEASEEKKKIKKVIKGSVKTKKKSKFSKITEAFIPEDVGDIKTFVISDVLIPAGKKVISDVVDTLLYGESGHRKKSSGSGLPYISYNRYSDKKDRRSINDARGRSGYSYDDIILETRGEAEDVLTCLEDLIDQYDVASVADLYDLVGMSRMSNYTDNKYGWTNLRNAEVVHTRDGYVLRLPRAVPIK